MIIEFFSDQPLNFLESAIHVSTKIVIEGVAYEIVFSNAKENKLTVELEEIE